MSSRDLFLASTPLIALEAAGAALTRGGRAQLVLIEDFDLAPRLCELLQRWPDRPFEMIYRLPGRHTEHQRGAGNDRRRLGDFLHRIRVKRELRTQTLGVMKNIDAEFQPDAVWVGNDRKVECQYAMHLASERLRQRAGRYLDDGLHTYLGRMRQRTWVRRVDWLVKRLGYGGWGQRVAQLGTTPWIAESWLAFPDDAVDKDPERTRHTLPRTWFTGRAFQRLAALAAKDFGVDRAALRRCAIVLALPHSNLLRASPDLCRALGEFVAQAGARGQHVALKYHPREMESDPAGLFARGNAMVLPKLVPMELLLPLLPTRAVLVGEGSTALLAAHWLRPDLRVLDLGISRNAYALRAREFFASHGIPTIHGDLTGLCSAGDAQPA